MLNSSKVIAWENIRFSALFTTGTFRMKESLRLSDRNSILMTQINVHKINPVGSKYKFVTFYE